MKICNNCKSIFQDNSKSICPRCNILLADSYSLYDKKDLVNDISNDGKTLWNISWRVFLMLFSVLGIIGVISGFSIYSYVGTLNNTINEKIAKEFDKPNITATIEKVAQKNASEQITNKIEPEVRRFNSKLAILVLSTDSIIIDKTKQFEKDLIIKSKRIDDKVIEVNNSINKIEQSKDEIMKIEKEMQEIKEMAAPPIFIYKDLLVEKIENGYRLRIVFEPSKTVALGAIDFTITLINTKSEIISMDNDPKYGGLSYSNDMVKISPDKKSGNINYAFLGGTGFPSVIFEISEKCDFKVESNYLEKPYNVMKSEY